MHDALNPNTKKAYSVQDIVRIWTNRSSDTWKLALVQRDAAWDEYRAAKLLDSLLRGYPIGGLLLCQTRESTRVLERGEIARRASVDDQAWQLLDGQQRTLAIAAIFAPSSTEGARFFLNMSEQLIDLAAKGRDNKIRRYITWQTLTSQESFSSGRRFWIDLGCLGAALLKDAAVLGDERSEKTLEELCALLKVIDPEFDEILPGGDDTFMQRIQAIKRIWFEEWIPIHRVKLESAAEVLQVFTRVNLEGVRTSPTDIFFAGVKTCWNDAEELLDGMAQYVKGLDRYDALRLSARVASFQKHQQDLIPLDLNRLKGAQGQELVDGMKNVVGLMQTNCIKQVGDYFVSGKGLGYAMHFVDKHLLDHVFCWVLQRSRNNQGELSDHSLSRLAAYLVGATAFRLYPIFGDTFSRLVFEICFAAEQREEDFPIALVLTKVKDRWRNLRHYRTQVPRLHSEEDARELVRASPHLFLSIVQSLPYRLPDRCGLDWDHIYAQSLAHRMKWRGERGEEHLRYHSDYDLVWKVGNLCGLSAFLNRSAGNKRPIEKLEDIKRYQDSGVVWAPDLFISSQEKEMLLAADRLLDEKKIADAMRAFKSFVEAREGRIWQEALRKLPDLQMFTDILRPEL
jgi:hypothetical protein